VNISGRGAKAQRHKEEEAISGPSFASLTFLENESDRIYRINRIGILSILLIPSNSFDAILPLSSGAS